MAPPNEFDEESKEKEWGKSKDWKKTQCNLINGIILLLTIQYRQGKRQGKKKVISSCPMTLWHLPNKNSKDSFIMWIQFFFFFLN